MTTPEPISSIINKKPPVSETVPAPNPENISVYEAWLNGLKFKIEEKKLFKFFVNQIKYLNETKQLFKIKRFYIFNNIADYRIGKYVLTQYFSIFKSPKKLLSCTGDFVQDALSGAKQWEYCENRNIFWLDFKTLESETFYNINIRQAQINMLNAMYYNDYAVVICGFEKFIDEELINQFEIIRY